MSVEFQKRYRLDETIAKRHEGTVVRARRNTPRQSRRIVKIVDIDKVVDAGKHRVYREPRFLKFFSGNDLIVQMHRCVRHKNQLFLIIEDCAKGDLLDFISDHTKNIEVVGNPRWIDRTERRMVAAVALLHKNDIAHRDIKLENFFVRANNSVCLGDFGLATYVTDAKHCAAVGTIAYVAPELLECSTKKVDIKKCDVYSLGITLFALRTQRLPFPVIDADEVLAIKKNMTCPPELVYYPDNYRDLIMNMMNPNPKKRFTIEDVLDHPYFS